LFAVSLSPSPLTVSQQQAVVEMCGQRLLTPVGLRSLEPKNPAYCPKYEGDLFKRDGCYHQGTVWGWLLGPYLEALLRAYDFARPAVEKAGAVIAGVEPHLRQACVGQFSEIFDADPPHKPRGAPAQAWSVAEILRIRALLRSRRRV
jgi:glycogen debranching enzyme